MKRPVRVPLLLLVVLTAGCASTGPHQITADGKTYYTQKVNYTGGGVSFTDAIEGYERRVSNPAHVVRLTPQEYEWAVSRATAQRDAEREKWLAAQERHRAYEKERLQLKWRVQEKDWQRWYDLFIADGYAHDEAVYKANEMMRGR